MSILQINADGDYQLDLTNRIFDVQVLGGSLVLNEAIPDSGTSPMNLTLMLDPEMLNVILSRVEANKPQGAYRVQPTRGYCSVCGKTAQQDPQGTWEHLEFSCESPKAKFTVTPPHVENPNDIKVAIGDLVGKVKPLRPAMSPTLRSVIDKVEEWARS